MTHAAVPSKALAMGFPADGSEATAGMIHDVDDVDLVGHR